MENRSFDLIFEVIFFFRIEDPLQLSLYASKNNIYLILEFWILERFIKVKTNILNEKSFCAFSSFIQHMQIFLVRQIFSMITEIHLPCAVMVYGSFGAGPPCTHIVLGELSGFYVLNPFIKPGVITVNDRVMINADLVLEIYCRRRQEERPQKCIRIHFGIKTFYR